MVGFCDTLKGTSKNLLRDPMTALCGDALNP